MIAPKKKIPNESFLLIYRFELRQTLLKQQDEHFVVLWNIDAGDFGQALQRDVAKHGYAQELENERADQFSFKDVPQRDPVQETEEGLQRCTN